MALILRDIYEATRQHFQLELIAGGDGLDRPMNWVYVSEDYTTSNFLHGGELIITTGVISGGRSAWLLRMLHHITQQHTCGLIINEGPYLNRTQISQEVLDFCNQNGFPLFLMPWHVHIYDVTRDYCDRIFTHNQHQEALRRAFETLLDPQGEQGPALRLLGDNGFSPQNPCCAVLFPIGSVTQPNTLLSHQLNTFLLPFSVPSFLLLHNQALILICQCDQPSAVRPAAEELQKQLSAFFPQPLAAGIGGQSPTLALLARSVEQAQAALSWAKGQSLPLACYDDMGFFRLLLEVKDRTFLASYVQELLGPVLQYDDQHGTDLTGTLYLYLLHNRSIQAVAAAAFCHRNTVSHRLGLLQEKLGYQLEDPMACFQLLTAFQVREFLRFLPF